MDDTRTTYTVTMEMMEAQDEYLKSLKKNLRRTEAACDHLKFLVTEAHGVLENILNMNKTDNMPINAAYKPFAQKTRLRQEVLVKEWQQSQSKRKFWRDAVVEVEYEKQMFANVWQQEGPAILRQK
jgi:hypothetical protein